MGKHEVSNKQKVFRDSIGQKATVQREDMGTEAAAKPNRMLIDLGLAVQDEPKHKLQTYRYMGSAAVHIYVNETLGQLDIVTQANPLVLYRCPEDLAAKGLEDLAREMQAQYGKKKGRLRSGF